MKLNVRRLLIFLLIAALSVGFGYGYDALATALEKRSHPQPAAYAEMVLECAAEFGVPEAMIWAVALEQSGFTSNAVNGERVGLMQLTPSEMEKICTEVLHTEVPDAGMLYDPRTNLRLGTAYLSSLYRTYGMWEPVLAALVTSPETASGWLHDPACLSPQGRLVKIPDRTAAAFVKDVQKAAAMYTELYY